MAENMLSLIEEISKLGLIHFNNRDSERLMPYSGTVSEVYSRLKEALNRPDPERGLELFLYANRLLSGIIDYGIKTGTDVLALKQNVERFCLEAYRKNYKSAGEILVGLEIKKEVLDSPVVEKKDHVSWAAFNPEFVELMIRSVKSRGFHPDYIILDGHDAYRPGFMAATCLDSRVCAIRNAQDSGRDPKPRLLNGEEEYLRSELARKRVLVMGEDFSTGRALKSLVDMISRTVSVSDIKTAAPISLPGGEKKIHLDYFGVEKNCFN